MIFPSGALVALRGGAAMWKDASEADANWYATPGDVAIVIEPWDDSVFDWAWVISKHGKVLITWDDVKELERATG